MDDIDRFLAKVPTLPDDVCWEWGGSPRNDAGYGSFYAEGRVWVAHRWLLGYLRGRHLMWPGEVGIHSCDNKSCVNPSHLRVGTHSENTREAIERSGHPAAGQISRTHCQRGHELTPENTHWYKGTQRYCRTCKRDDSRESMCRQRLK